jgi:hypothetical protein
VKPVLQTILRGDSDEPTRRGNCLQAAVASVFEVPLEDVPHFVAEEDWWGALERWLAARNVEVLYLPANEFVNNSVRVGRDAFYLVDGKSPRGEFFHVVVWRGHEMVHDPHPSGDGLDGHPVGVFYFVAADPARLPTLVDA